MEAKNQINIDKLQEKLNKIKEVSERMKNSLNNINSLITETVGQNVGVWDGESASDFRTSWDQLSNDIPSYIKILQTQINNLEIVINNFPKT